MCEAAFRVFEAFWAGEAGTNSLPLVERDGGGGVQLMLLSSPFTLIASVLWLKVSSRPLAELSLCHTSSLCPFFCSSQQNDVLVFFNLAGDHYVTLPHRVSN